MKKIKVDEKIYTLVNNYPEIREVLIDMGMKPIADDKNLNTVGRIISLKQALKQVSMDKDRAQVAMNKIGIEVDFDE